MSQDKEKGTVSMGIGSTELGSWVIALKDLVAKLTELQDQQLIEQAEKEQTQKIAEELVKPENQEVAKEIATLQNSLASAVQNPIAIAVQNVIDGYGLSPASETPEVILDGYGSKPCLVVEDVWTPREEPGVLSVIARRGGPNGVYHETFTNWFTNYQKQKVVKKVSNPKYDELQDFLQKKGAYFTAEYSMKDLEKSYTADKQQLLMEATSLWLKHRMEYETHSMQKLIKTSHLDPSYFQPLIEVEESQEDLSKLPAHVVKIKYFKEQMRKFGEVGIVSRSESITNELPPEKVEEITRRVQQVEKSSEAVQEVENASVKKIEEVFAQIKVARANTCTQCQNPHFDGLCECPTNNVPPVC
jgi:hypothetical protein